LAAAALDESSIRAILLDIEGTTTPVDFVYKTLFPYARDRAPEFLRAHWDDPDVREDVAGLRAQHQADAAANLAPPPWPASMAGSPASGLNSAIAYVGWLMDRDSKSSPLKSLQGKIWREGYAKGELHGELFPDALAAILRWTRQGKRIAIFSSGSVLAQKLLFSTVASCDLTRLIEAYFDTSVGAKDDPQSYLRIAEALALPAREIVFISDVARELDAAQDAGMQTALCVRGEAPPEAACGKYPVVRSFNTICRWEHRRRLTN
jgi:enolase-phosphatase E1